MPTLIINTNVPKGKVPATLSGELSKTVAKCLGKPESYVAVLIQTDSNLIFGGTSEPAAISTLGSIGQINTSKNKATSQAVQNLLQKQLGISTSRQYLMFEDLKKENVGYQGTTFDDLI